MSIGQSKISGMSAASRVSAFAKRRKLNDASTAPTSESDNSNSTPITRNAKTTKAVAHGVNTTKIAGQEPVDVNPTQTDLESDGDENSFAPLVDAKAVSFIGTREIEALDNGDYNVRLSKGQKCSIQGITRLWIREGSVCIDSATLNESCEAYTVFCSTYGSFTDIVAQSKVAEFQLSTVTASMESLPSANNVPGKLGEFARRGATSFQILERSEGGDKSVLEATNDITELTRTVSNHITTVAGKGSTKSQILVCGKRSADTYKASVALVNRLLTRPPGSHKSYPSKIQKHAMLDLDYLSPAFSAPGTISLAVLQRPIFGVSYTQPLQHEPEHLNHLVVTHYVQANEDSEKPKLNLNCIQMILQMVKSHIHDSNLVIRTGSWFAHMSLSEKSRFQTLLQPSVAICIDTNKSSQHLEAARSLLKDKTALTVLHLPVSPISSLSSLQEHKLQLQSHFRVYETIGGSPTWYREPVADIAPARRLVLSTDSSKDELKFIQVRGGMLRPQDIPDAIRRNFVVIVAVQKDEESQSSAYQHGDAPTLSNTPADRIDMAQSLVDIRRTEGDEILHFIGLAFVEEVDVQERTLTLNTPVSMEGINHHKSLHREMGLVLEKPDTNGRFGRHLLFA